jgi:hypothetical protein
LRIEDLTRIRHKNGRIFVFGAGRPGFDSRQVKIFLFCTAPRPALGSIQPPTKWVPGVLFLGVKRPGREFDHCNAEAKNGGAIPLSLVCLNGIKKVKLSLTGREGL